MIAPVVYCKTLEEKHSSTHEDTKTANIIKHVITIGTEPDARAQYAIELFKY